MAQNHFSHNWVSPNVPRLVMTLVKLKVKRCYSRFHFHVLDYCQWLRTPDDSISPRIPRKQIELWGIKSTSGNFRSYQIQTATIHFNLQTVKQTIEVRLFSNLNFNIKYHKNNFLVHRIGNDFQVRIYSTLYVSYILLHPISYICYSE